MLDRAGRIKPCGGAIPPRLIRDFDDPRRDHRRPRQCRAHDLAARPSASTCPSTVAMSAWSIASISTNGSASAPAKRGPCAAPARSSGSRATSRASRPCNTGCLRPAARARPYGIRTRLVIGADGADSGVARAEIKDGDKVALCVRLPRDRQVAARHEERRFRFQALRCLLPGSCSRRTSTRGSSRTARRPASAPAPLTRDFRCAAPVARPAQADRSRRLRNGTARGRAHPAEAAETLGQWPGRCAGRRCRGYRRAGLGRGHLLRHVRRPAARPRRPWRRFATGDARGARHGAPPIHEGARPGVLDPRR